MKAGYNLLLANVPSTICVSLSGYMAINNVGSWGWFLFAAVILTHYYGSKE